MFFRRYDISGSNQPCEAWDFCTFKTCHTIFEEKICFIRLDRWGE